MKYQIFLQKILSGGGENDLNTHLKDRLGFPVVALESMGKHEVVQA